MSAFHGEHSASKHLLTLYSVAIGLGAQRVAEIGIGTTTRALRAALSITGGVLDSCDGDRRRFEPLLAQQDDRWHLHLEPSSRFLRRLVAPIDLLLHDGAHDYHQVREDLELALPKMRMFGLVLIHDTQQRELAGDMLAAVRDASRYQAVSFTNLPYCAGLGILRVEASTYPPGRLWLGEMPAGGPETHPVPMATVISEAPLGEVDARLGRARRRIRRRARRIVKGF